MREIVTMDSFQKMPSLRTGHITHVSWSRAQMRCWDLELETPHSHLLGEVSPSQMPKTHRTASLSWK